jgi:hypothetical protein
MPPPANRRPTSPRKRSAYRGPSPPTRKQNRVASPLASRTKTPSSPAVNTAQLRTDRLGMLVHKLTLALENAPSWEDFVTTFRGRSYLSPKLEDVNHPAAKLLRNWRDQGVTNTMITLVAMPHVPLGLLICSQERAAMSQTALSQIANTHLTKNTSRSKGLTSKEAETDAMGYTLNACLIQQACRRPAGLSRKGPVLTSNGWVARTFTTCSLPTPVAIRRSWIMYSWSFYCLPKLTVGIVFKEDNWFLYLRKIWG